MDIKSLEAKVLAGDANAMYDLGRGLDSGFVFSAGGKERGEKLLTQAEVKGHLVAKGYRLLFGLGVKKDEAAALQLFQVQAAHGDARAQYFLGEMYANGCGVEKDEKKACELYAQAAQQGFADAQNTLGLMYEHGRGVEKDEKKACELYAQAAEQGDADAQRNLGEMYEYGRGVEKDEKKACELYAQAAQQGHAIAQINLERLSRSTSSKPAPTPSAPVPTPSIIPAPAPTPSPPAPVPTSTSALAPVSTAASLPTSLSAPVPAPVPVPIHSSLVLVPTPTAPAPAIADELRLIPWSDLKLGQKLGAGSFGSAFLGSWNYANVVIKVPHAEEVNTPAKLNAFMQEARILHQLHHPYIVRCMGVVLQPNEGKYALVLEHVENGTAEDYIINKKNFASGSKRDQAALASISREVASALAHLHSRGHVHRDIASRNVLIDTAGHAKLNDFGMTRRLDGKAQGETKAKVGPVRWMSPESLLESKYSPQSDMWMFSVLLHELWTQSLPYDGVPDMQVMTKIATSGSFLEIPASLPPQIAALITKCQSRDPSARPTAAQACESLHSLITELNAGLINPTTSSSASSSVHSSSVLNNSSAGSSKSPSSATSVSSVSTNSNSTTTATASLSTNPMNFTSGVYTNPGLPSSSAGSLSRPSSASSSSSSNSILGGAKPATIEALLEELKLNHLISTFKENEIESFSVLSMLSDADLKELVPVLGQRVRIKKALVELGFNK